MARLLAEPTKFFIFAPDGVGEPAVPSEEAKISQGRSYTVRIRYASDSRKTDFPFRIAPDDLGGLKYNFGKGIPYNKF